MGHARAFFQLPERLHILSDGQAKWLRAVWILLFGLAVDTPAEAKSFNTIAFDPLNPKYAYVFTKYFKYLDTPVKTAQVPPGQ